MPRKADQILLMKTILLSLRPKEYFVIQPQHKIRVVECLRPLRKKFMSCQRKIGRILIIALNQIPVNRPR